MNHGEGAGRRLRRGAALVPARASWRGGDGSSRGGVSGRDRRSDHDSATSADGGGVHDARRGTSARSVVIAALPPLHDAPPPHSCGERIKTIKKGSTID